MPAETIKYDPFSDGSIQGHICERDAGKGRKVSYLQGAFVINQLNKILPGWQWEIQSQRELEIDGNYIVVTHGKLIVTINGEGKSMDGIGSEALKVGYADSIHKGSETDALKRAAMKLGMQFGLSLYPGTEDEEEDKPLPRHNPPKAAPPVVQAKSLDELGARIADERPTKVYGVCAFVDKIKGRCENAVTTQGAKYCGVCHFNSKGTACGVVTETPDKTFCTEHIEFFQSRLRK